MNKPDCYLTFRLEERSFALPVQVVERVIHAVEVTVIPDSPYILAGIINMEGEILGVINMRRCFNIQDREINEGDRFIIIGSANRRMALIVDSVSDILNVPPDDVTESEQIFKGLSQTWGAIRREDGVIPVIDIKQLINIHYENPPCEETEHGQAVV